MNKITQVLTAPGLTGFYFDDQAAIKHNAVEDGAFYRGTPETRGFSSVRQAGESISIMLVLDDGRVAYGDCAAVQYSGAGGRDPLFLADDFIPIVKEKVAPRLVGEKLDDFRRLAGAIEGLTLSNGKKLHTALRYGLTQALLDGVAKSQNLSRTEVVAQEYGLDLKLEPVPIFAQTGDERYLNADKIIIKQVDVLPHGLINNVNNKLGKNGEKLLEYVDWLKNRVRQIGAADYQPVFHIDVYGTIGLAFDHNIEAMSEYLTRLARAANPYKLRIEGPMDAGSKAEQIARMQDLKLSLAERDFVPELVADEWCNTLEDIREFVDKRAADMVQIKTPDLGGINNTIEAVLYCRRHGVGAYQGGTCNETDRSARISTDIALATRPHQILAKPGMGVDEGLMIVYNEMQRVLAYLRHKLRGAFDGRD